MVFYMGFYWGDVVFYDWWEKKWGIKIIGI